MTVILTVVVIVVAIVVVGIDGKTAAVIPSNRETETGIHRHDLEIVAHAVHADLNGAMVAASTVHLVAM